MTKYAAWATVYIGKVNTEEEPDRFADPKNPTKNELEKYFEDYQHELAGSNTGSERLANGVLEIEPDDQPDPTPFWFRAKPKKVSHPDHDANYEALTQNPWKDGSKVSEGVELYFHNITVVLNPDGTYRLVDTGGV